MLHRYKEIFFGLAFGIGAVLIDTKMDAIADGNSMMDEVIEHPGMLLYRAIFIVFGLLLGWLLWQSHRREREVRQTAETLGRIRQECGAQGLLLGSTLQRLLTRDDLHLSEEASRLLQDAYAKSQEFQRIAEQSPAVQPASPRAR
jgi:hypothetical protein